MSFLDQFEDLNLEDLFTEHVYPSSFEKIKSSKQKDAIMYLGFYYNHSRENLKSTKFKCREKVNGKECTGSFTLYEDESFTIKPHGHPPMLPIECDIKKMRLGMCIYFT